ncbi:MAG: LamG domain-containing protein [Candidatus Pacearchaeota archaeon]|jgi:hypothetical protein
MFNKKGVSGVVVSVLLILITIAVISIIGTFIFSFINSNTEKIEAGANQVNLQIENNKVMYGPTNLDIGITRATGAGNLSGVNIVITGENGNSYTYKYEGTMSELETKIISIPISDFSSKVSKVSKITVTPVVTISSGKKYPTSIKDEYVPDTGFISRAASSDTYLKLYLPFDNDMNDHSASGFNSTCIISTVPYCPSATTNGKINGAYNFKEGTIVNTTANLTYGNNNEMTMMAWVKLSNTCDRSTEGQGNSCYIITKGQWGTGNPARLGVNYNNFSFIAGGSDTNQLTQVNPKADDRQWHHVVGTTKGTDASLFVDGIKIETHTFTPSQLNDPIVIGGKSPGPTYRNFNGTIDEVRVWDRALSDDEIYYWYRYN